MLEVILYRRNRRGRLSSQECRFDSIRALRDFFSTGETSPWEGAEVNISAVPGLPRIVDYSADRLRTMIMASGREPSLN